jgi:hypothetical protein
MTRRQQALEFFVAQGWTLAQAAGIVANLEAESGLHPDAVGDGGRAYGIAQWHPDRQAIFAGMMGEPVQGSSFEDQLYFVHAELQGAEKRAGDALAACTTAAEAGACVSKLYERPADREGEAAKRAALAERIFQAYDGAAQDGAGEPIPPPLAPPPIPPEIGLPRPGEGQIPPQPEQPMGLAFLPYILQMVPALIGIFGKGGERAQANQAAAQIVVDTFTKAVPGAPNTQAAVEMAQASEPIREAAARAVLAQPDIVDLLNRLGPTFDRLHKIDLDQRAADIGGRNAAMERQQADTSGTVQIVVQNVANQSWMVLGGLIVALIAAAVAKGFFPDMPDYFTVILALAGPLFGQVMKERGAIIGYYFDGTPTSNAAAAMNQKINQTK